MREPGFFAAAKHPAQPVSIPPSVREHLARGKTLAIVGLGEDDMRYAQDVLERYFAEQPHSRSPGISKVYSSPRLYEKLSLIDNIFIDRQHHFRNRTRILLNECRALFHRFGVNLDPLCVVGSLTEDEMKVVDLICAYAKKPSVLFLRDPMATLSYYHTSVYEKVLDAIKADGCILVYLSTKWENALSVGDFFGIVSREVLLDRVFLAEELKRNPRRLVYLLSGLEQDGESPSAYDASVDALQSLYKSSQLFIKNYELESTLNFLAREIASTMGVDICVLYLLDERERIHSFCDANCDPHYLRSDFLDLFLKDDNDMFHLPLCSFEAGNYFEESGSEPCAMLCLPIHSEARRIGLLALIHSKNFICSEQQLVALHTFCNEVSIIVETSKLINQSTLLQESHHRIKNNLQIIVALLYNQKRHLQICGSDPEAISGMESLVSRIKSISLVHDLLTNNAHGGNIIVLDHLVDELLRLWDRNEIHISKDIEPLSIAYNKATSLAMILNELISNCFRHAYEERQFKELSIFCRLAGEMIVLRVADNGCGLPDNFSLHSGASVGMSIVSTLTKTLRGTIEAASNNGTVITLRVPVSQIASNFVL